MRILFLSQLLPFPLDAGPKIRSYYVLRYLAEAGHEITLVCFIRPEDKELNIQLLRKICRSIHCVPLVRSRFKDTICGLKSLTTKTPFLISRDRIPEMIQTINEIAGSCSFDAVHADQLWMASYGLAHGVAGIKVLDQHNAVFKVPLRMAACSYNPFIRAFLKKESSKLAEYERTVCQMFDRITWVTEEDRTALLSDSDEGLGKHHVIPIAVDPSSQTPVEKNQPFRITFLGGMHWPPNADGISWFSKKIWPALSESVPEAILTLIGKSSTKKLLRAKYGNRIQMTGYVSDIKQYLSETAAFIVPLRIGAGMRVKILDAWCWGLPVVSTSIGAEGVQAVHDENLLIADDEEGFKECIIRVLRDTNLSRRLTQKGRFTVESQYDWRKIYPAWDRIYR